jgi:hypothetical protein
MKAYYYLYYRIYSAWIKIKGSDHAFLAMVALSLLLMLNISTLILYFDLLNDMIYDDIRLPIILGVILVLVVNYFVFIYRNKYKKIKKLFMNETKRQKIIGSIIIITYILLTFVLLFSAL